MIDLGLTERQGLVLAALASSPGASFAPVQLQKLFFLIDENIADELGGKLFRFEPYDYGPFDKDVYTELGRLEQQGLANISRVETSERRRYTLTAEGQTSGAEILASLTPRAQAYIGRVSAWVRGLTFAQLVGSIYKAYPSMRTNSVFED
jgi:DNA-binding MarR family transcriptional regulator